MNTAVRAGELLDEMSEEMRAELLELLHSIPEETKKKAIVYLREPAGEDQSENAHS